MIVCRKPCTLYDVDLIGLAVVAALAAAAWWLVAVPWQRTWQDYLGMAARHSAAQKGLREDLLELKTYETGLAGLRDTIAGESDTVPHVTSIARQLRRMTDLAREAGVEIQSVTPLPAVQEGEYAVNDIQVAGRGRSVDFIRFLDRLAQDNPYQSLQQCSIQRSLGVAEPECKLSWSVRLYLLPVAATARAGGPS